MKTFLALKDKVEKKLEASLLQRLPIPREPFAFVYMDFVFKLPKVANMHSNLVLVDHFSTYAVFIATIHGCIAHQTSKLCCRKFVKYFALP